MGYYVDGSGSITFLATTAKEIEEIYDILSSFGYNLEILEVDHEFVI